MNALTAAIHKAISEDVTIKGKVSTYNNLPAVFTIQPIPEDVKPPYIIISGPITDSPWDTKTTEGRDITRDIRCYTDDTGSVKDVDDIAEQVRKLFHRKKLSVTGYDNIITTVTGISSGDDEGYYGRIVTIRAILEVA